MHAFVRFDMIGCLCRCCHEQRSDGLCEVTFFGCSFSLPHFVIAGRNSPSVAVATAIVMSGLLVTQHPGSRYNVLYTVLATPTVGLGPCVFSFSSMLLRSEP